MVGGMTRTVLTRVTVGAFFQAHAHFTSCTMVLPALAFFALHLFYRDLYAVSSANHAMRDILILHFATYCAIIKTTEDTAAILER